MWLEATQRWLGDCVLKALKQNVAHNGSGLPPFRLPHITRQIVAGLRDFAASNDAAVVQATGESLGRMGLALRSLAAAQRASLRASLLQQLEAAQVAVVQDYMSLLIEGVAGAGIKEFAEQRDEMQLLLERAIQRREDDLRKIIQDLSTPVMPVHEQILVLPLVGGIDDERAQRITERLLDAVSRRRARMVIIDITGVAELDTGVAEAVLRTARAVSLLGASVVLVGIRPELAMALVQRDVDLAGLVTLADLQSGIAHALREQGLGIHEIRARQPRSSG